MSRIELKRPDHRRQMWVYLIALLFLADFAFYGYLPSHRRLRSLREAHARQEHVIRTAAQQSKELPSLQTRLKSVGQIIEHYDAYIPYEASLGMFLQEIARIMTQHRLTDQVVVPGKETESDGVRCISVHVNCKGSLKDVFSFFRDFQAMDRLVRIEQVTLQNDSGLRGGVTMDADAMIFHRPRTERDTTDLAGGASEVENSGA